MGPYMKENFGSTTILYAFSEKIAILIYNNNNISKQQLTAHNLLKKLSLLHLFSVCQFRDLAILLQPLNVGGF